MHDVHCRRGIQTHASCSAFELFFSFVSFRIFLTPGVATFSTLTLLTVEADACDNRIDMPPDDDVVRRDGKNPTSRISQGGSTPRGGWANGLNVP